MHACVNKVFLGGGRDGMGWDMVVCGQVNYMLD